MLRVARAHAVRERRSALQLMRATIVSSPDELRDQVRNLTRMQLIRTLAAWRPDVSNASDPVTAHRVALKSFARRYLELADNRLGNTRPCGWNGDKPKPQILVFAPCGGQTFCARVVYDLSGLFRETVCPSRCKNGTLSPPDAV